MGVIEWLWGTLPDETDDVDGQLDSEGDYSYFSWFWRYWRSVDKASEESLEEREKRCNDLLLALDAPDDVKSLNHEEEPDHESEEGEEEGPWLGKGCTLRTGRITSLLQESGQIDGNIFFNRTDAPDTLCVNDEVTYFAYRSDESVDWKVKKILPVQPDCNWDSENGYEETYSQNPECLERETMYRSELRKVTGRNGRIVIVNDGEYQFNLDEVSTLFTPVVGDFIFLDAVVLCDDNVVDFGGEILDIERIRWVRYKLVTGQVSHVDSDGNGIVGKDIYFSKESCLAGYMPCKGDDVSVDPIESYQGKCSWRALSVKPLQTLKKNIRINCNAATSEVEMLLESKNGVSIRGELDFGQIQKGKLGKELTISLANNGDKQQALIFGDFHLARRGCQVFPLGQVGRKVIEPGETLDYTFGCRAKFIGPSRELFVFCFKDFKIGCNFEIDVYDHDSLDLLVDNGGHGHNKYGTRHSKTVTRSNRHYVIKGEMPVQPPKFIAFRFDNYNIPDRFWNTIFDSTNTLKPITDIKEGLIKTSPALCENLSFKNYRERFHALIYLEEIDSRLKVERFSMESAVLGRGGEYLSLEVPGLAEKRPSLLVGDKALVSRPWKEDDIVYEGYVHKTFGKSVLLKFHNEFHLTYNEQVVNIRFELGRSAIKRQHGAIDLAMTHLGEQILFPSRLTLQEPQVDLVEYTGNNKEKIRSVTEFSWVPDSVKREISWFNKKLNHHQRLAVCNVLKGEARPLPYIIFGPPGTGKTMTLVETILQILFLLPDSRLLVATPSNSSANLITERLLDSNLLKPGDLVRLVGYHVLEDGSLPERLRPYSTTGIIKDVRGEEAKALPIGQLRESSNKNTLGRHRITVGTCIALGQLVTMGFPQGHFTHVVVDEAGQATEPEIMVPLGFLDCSGQAILAGDPEQLGPVVGSSLALHYGLGESYLERLIYRFPYELDPVGFPASGGHDPRLVTQLIDNYRSLPEILALPNTMFYKSRLVPQISSHAGPDADLLKQFELYLPKRDDVFGGPAPILFHGVVGMNLQDVDSPSWFNPHETLIAMDYLSMVYSCGVGPDDVGIITPYRKQVQKMRWYFSRLNIALPKIGSVEEFQGQERKVIILSAVRSSAKDVETDLMHALGFVQSPKRLNVAITRARTLLIIVGNPHLLSMDSHWRVTLKYCIARQCYTGCDPPVSCVAPQDDGHTADVAGVN